MAKKENKAAQDITDADIQEMCDVFGLKSTVVDGKNTAVMGDYDKLPDWLKQDIDKDQAEILNNPDKKEK